MSATTRLESRPPESIAPSGTSLIESKPNCLAEELEELLGVLGQRTCGLVGALDGVPPVGVLAHRAVLDDELMAGQELANPGNRRVRPGDEPERQVCVDRALVELDRNESARQERS